MTVRKTSSRPAPAETQDPDIDQAVLRSMVGYNMKRAYLTVRADFVASLAHLALNASQFSALSLIVANPGVSQSALARALSVERSAVVALIDNLERRGFVSRDPVPRDRRSYALRATLAGILHCDRAIETIRAHEERAFARLSASERATLVDLLARVEG
jgi:DNA-binding MarR family transcriptional regulator